MSDDSVIQSIQAFFDRDLCRRATKPLRGSASLLFVVDADSRVLLTKTKEGVRAELAGEKVSPDMTFEIPKPAYEKLLEIETDDLGVLGIEIAKLLVHEDINSKIKTKIHIGGFELLTKGYFGIIPLGGGTLMKFLATKGLTSLGKIKEAMARLRE